MKWNVHKELRIPVSGNSGQDQSKAMAIGGFRDPDKLHYCHKASYSA
jgi:hypothetical protein